ncbi:uncharacterized protein TrAFT101_003600 [Trichoderma asperellum]|uniref:uncharacterized protein n=1 Tax=Trichoderma asperellum TaxID=101201 RepID=UPI0033251E0E|nr:hypothetical protein TrAFT101_003600 [Trichoderma asperellum]
MRRLTLRTHRLLSPHSPHPQEAESKPCKPHTRPDLSERCLSKDPSLPVPQSTIQWLSFRNGLIIHYPIGSASR